MTSAIAERYAASQAPSPPRLRFSTRAGLGLAGTPATGSPAAQRMPAMMSESYPPHLPSTRTGSTRTLRPTLAMPMPLPVSAAMMPLVCVPCHELSSALSAQSSKTPPDCVHLGEREPVAGVGRHRRRGRRRRWRRRTSLIMSYPGSRLPPAATLQQVRVVEAHARVEHRDDDTRAARACSSMPARRRWTTERSPEGARRYHWPAGGPPVVAGDGRTRRGTADRWARSSGGDARPAPRTRCRSRGRGARRARATSCRSRRAPACDRRRRRRRAARGPGARPAPARR